jgi:hypothetical protein
MTLLTDYFLLLSFVFALAALLFLGFKAIALV